MTSPARVTQRDMERAMTSAAKSAKAAGYSSARVIVRLDKAEIEAIIGDLANDSPDLSEWTDDDT